MKILAQKTDEKFVLEIVGQEKLKYLKDKAGGGKVILSAFIICQEGPVMGSTVDGEGQHDGFMEGVWTQEGVFKFNIKLAEAIGNRHLFAFNSHFDKNRKPVGEVVANKILMIKGKLSSVCVVHMFDIDNGYEYENISMEADLRYTEEYDMSGKKVNKIDGVYDITAVALGGQKEKPGVPGAVKIAKIAANDPRPFNIKDISFSELMKELESRNIHPTQIYSVKDILGETNVEDGVVHITGGDREVIKEFRKREQAIKESYTKKIKELEGQVTELKQFESKAKVIELRPQVVDKIIQESKDTKFTEYVKRMKDDISIDIEKGLEDNITSVTKQISESYNKIKDLVGVPSSNGSSEPFQTNEALPQPSGEEPNNAPYGGW